MCAGEKKILKNTAVPSVFVFRQPTASVRCSQRSRALYSEASSSVVVCSSDTIAEISTIGAEVECLEQSTADTAHTATQPVESLPVSQTAEVQCQLITPQDCRLSVFHYVDNPDAIKYYTGFDNFDHFRLLFDVLGPAVTCLSYRGSALQPIDHLFLTLIKLRQAKDDFELSLMFKICKTTVAAIVNTWINFLYFQLKEINTWPSRSVVQQHMPDNFGNLFGQTRVILDATEIPIAKPTNVNAQSSTFSTYKNRNTLKTMVGCTPRGLVSFIGDSYGGSASDRQLIERSPLYLNPHMFEPGDVIMADRGIMVQDLFACKDVSVNTPLMLKGRSQFEPHEIRRDRRIASKRIHIERVIGLSKTFKILKKELPSGKRILGSRIVFICFMLCNFRTAIVTKRA